MLKYRPFRCESDNQQLKVSVILRKYDRSHLIIGDEEGQSLKILTDKFDLDVPDQLHL